MLKLLFSVSKFVFLFGTLLSISLFATKRNERRKIRKGNLEFSQSSNFYVDEDLVQKILIQKPERATNVKQEYIVLNKAEKHLNKYTMIQNSEVYLTVSGKLKAKIKQRIPVARVQAIVPYYIDDAGIRMPLSDRHVARVPLLYNISEYEAKKLFPLLKQIGTDDFLKKHITSIRKDSNKEYLLTVRVYDFKIFFGSMDQILHKIKNFKAFYQKAKKDNSLFRYKKVNLAFQNQVVCTLK